MLCPSCGKRSARRACPALRRHICPSCCGSKRLVEIACPDECGYLAAAQAHPAAVVRRQQEQDVAFLQAILADLSGPQQEVALTVVGFVARSASDPLLRLSDPDIVDAASSMASTFETSARGLIYEHRPQSLVAQRLVTDLGALLEQARQQRGRGFDADAAAGLRRLADAFGKGLAGTGPRAGLETVIRIARFLAEAAKAEAPPSGLAAPGPTIVQP